MPELYTKEDEPFIGLYETFGIRSLKPQQEEIYTALMQGKHVLATLPTGYGKSLIYQYLSTRQPGLTLVVSPLIALIDQQVAMLQTLGIRAESLHGGKTVSEQAKTMEALKQKRVSILYTTPERATSKSFQMCCSMFPISYLVVDEAHCVSNWGKTFRTQYAQLKPLHASLNAPPILALTATLTLSQESDLHDMLFPIEAEVVRIKGAVDRPNLHLSFRWRRASIFDSVREWIIHYRHQKGIVYTPYKRLADRLAMDFCNIGLAARSYHGALSAKERKIAQEAFERGQAKLMVATQAFGLGIDLPDVRYIVHTHLPRSPESYVQEIGRAGRDGNQALCVAFYHLKDYRTSLEQMSMHQALTERSTEALTTMYRIGKGLHCRRSRLYHKFGLTTGNCNACDRCLSTPLQRLCGILEYGMIQVEEWFT